MGLFDIFKRKKTVEDVLADQAERVRRELFPNGLTDCVDAGKRISGILQGKMSPKQCAAFYAALATIKHLSPVMCAAIFRDRVIKMSNGLADPKQALEIFIYVCGMEDAPFKPCPGDSLDQPFFVQCSSRQEAELRHFQVMEEAWGRYERDWCIYMHFQHQHHGRLLDCYSLVLNDGSKAQYYFATDEFFGKN